MVLGRLGIREALGFFTLFFILSVNGQQPDPKVKLSGRIMNNWTHEGAVGVNVYIQSLGIGTATDHEGYYELKVPKGQFRITFSSVENETEVRIVDITEDLKLNIFVSEKSMNLDAVTILSESEDIRVTSLDVGKNTLSIERIKALPSFMGENDIIQGLIMLPGVSTVGEGSSGFNVRGGSVDQNLILQDGAIIFNPSHIFGFFSVFNPAVVKDATLYKSGIPAGFGGRLSSVLNVELKEGDYQDYHASAGIGIVSSKFELDGPVIRDKLSFLVGGRASYSDWLLKTAKASEFKNSTASFYDTNLKLSWIINEKNKLSYSGYYSKDGFGFASDTTFNWSTFNTSLAWKYLIDTRRQLDVHLVSGKYKYTIEDPAGLNAFDIKSSITHTSLRTQFSYEPSTSNRFTAGLEGILYQFAPGHQRPLGHESGVEELILEDEKSLETAAFVEGDFKISTNLSIRAGLRYSSFTNIGEGVDFLFQEGLPMDLENVSDTIHHGKGEVIKFYSGLEPRINITYLLNPVSSVKLSYNRQRQYLHLISNTAAVTPTDFWKTSNRYIAPEVGDQYTIGYFHNFRKNTIEASVEIYYKKADNIVDFQNGSRLLMNEYIEADLLNGTSDSYGVEFFLNKKIGAITGWAGYTFSRTFRTVDSPFRTERINNGNPYPANFDKPHDVSIAMNYEPSPVLKYGFNFSYSTGRPVTVPLGAYNLSNLTNIFNYSLRNLERIPDYHRLDASMTLKSKPRIDRKWQMSWTFAVYNLYGYKNAYSVFFEHIDGAPPKAFKLSVLGSAFPSITVNFDI